MATTTSEVVMANGNERARRTLNRHLFADVHADIEDASDAKRLMLARVLYAYGYNQTLTCSSGVHIGCDYTKCLCDCHLEDEQYIALHGVPKTG